MIVHHFVPETNVKCIADFTNVYYGQSCFMLSPGPPLKQEDLSVLSHPAVLTLGINNAPIILYKQTGQVTDLWVGCDRPKCFLDFLLRSPKMTKFGTLKHANEKTEEGETYKNCPNMYFFEVDPRYFKPSNFFEWRKELLWWNSTFMSAVQLCWRLGFRRLFLAGSGFRIKEKDKYGHESGITKEEVEMNAKLYRRIVRELGDLRRYCKTEGFEIFNCTPGGELEVQGICPSLSLLEAVQMVTGGYPSNRDTLQLPHCSRLRKGRVV